jgi:hypothetical protein
MNPILKYLSLFLLSLNLLGFTPNVDLRITPERGPKENPFELTVTLNAALDGPNLELPQVPGLGIIHQGESSQFSWVNGQASRQVVHTFEVVAEAPGVYTIPSFTVSLDGTRVSSQPLTFQVTEEEAGGQEEEEPDDRPIFLAREFSNLTPYPGERVIMKTKLFYRVPVDDITPVPGSKSPKLRYEELGQKNEAAPPYQVVILEEAITPLESGEIEIPPFKLSLRVPEPRSRRRRIDDFFSDFFSDPRSARGTKKFLSTDAYTLSVAPFPEEGKPPEFKGLVGDFALEAHLSQNALTVGDSLTLTATLSGEGSLENLPNLDHYDPGENFKVYRDRPEVQGHQKTYKIAVVPKKPGTLTLPPLRIAFFQPKTASYKVLEKTFPPIEVTAQAEEPRVVVEKPPEPSEFLKDQDWKGVLEPIQTHWKWSLFLPILGGLFYGLRWLLRRRKAWGRTRVLFSRFEKTVSHSCPKELLAKAYKTCLGEVFGVYGPALTPEDWERLLAGQPQIPGPTKTTFIEMIKDLDRSLYSDEATRWPSAKELLPLMKDICTHYKEQP